jgi:GxxExxY protein
MDVHRELGNGFVEPVYHEALKSEFDRQGIKYAHEALIQIYYKDPFVFRIPGRFSLLWISHCRIESTSRGR